MQIPGYTIEKELGRGGMATVYLALQENLDRHVAVKVMSPALLADPSFSSRFLREAKIVAQLSHPHIIPIYDVSTDENCCYITMEYQPGGELNPKIKAGLTSKEAVSIISEIATALNFAHDKGYVHRDVKPANILFNDHGKSILSDFGVARQFDSNSQITEVGSIVGTPLYMSPEQAQGKKIDHRADLYSLGAVFYEMLVGSPPFRGESAVAIAVKHMTESIPQLPERHAEFQPIINKILHKDPEERYQSGSDIRLALEKIIGIDNQHSTINHNDLATVINQKAVKNPITESRPNSEIKTLLWIGLVSTVLLGTLILTGYLYFSRPADKPITAQAGSTKIPKPEIPVPQITNDKQKSSPPIETTQVAITFEQKKINEWLVKADRSLAEERYILPNNNNAHQQYLEVLDIEKNNARALSGIRTISNYFVEKVPVALKANKHENANKFLAQAKSIYSQHPDLDMLRGKIDASKRRYKKEQQKLAVEKLRVEQAKKENARKQREREKKTAQLKLQELAVLDQQKHQDVDTAKQKTEKQQQIEAQFATAKNLLEQVDASASSIDKAHQIIKQISKADPNNAALELALKWVVYGYANLADAALINSEHASAERFVEKGLTVNKKDTRLLGIKKAIEQSKNEPTKIFGGF